MTLLFRIGRIVAVAAAGFLCAVGASVIYRPAGCCVVSPYQAIIANLRAIDLAKQTWANENRKSDTAIPTTNDLASYMAGERFPIAGWGEKYCIGRVSARSCALLTKPIGERPAGTKIMVDTVK